jgi:AmmeMemoRadiSam system protein A
MMGPREDESDRATLSLTDAVVGLARLAVERHVRDGVRVDVPDLPLSLPSRAGAFVTIRDGKDLRGCVGTIEPVEPDLGAEIVRSAILAATEDPRFDPVRAGELPRLSYSVSVLEPPEEIDSIEQLDPARFGVIVMSGGRRGLLLPDIEGIDTPDLQVEIARRKAGIRPGSPVRLFRFRARQFPEHDSHG